MQISIATAAIGIAALIFLVNFVTPGRIAIAEIKTGQTVIVGGTVADFAESKGNVFFTLENGSSIKVVMFSTDAERFPAVYRIKNGANVTVSGKAQYYRSELEIIAGRID